MVYVIMYYEPTRSPFTDGRNSEKLKPELCNTI